MVRFGAVPISCGRPDLYWVGADSSIAQVGRYQHTPGQTCETTDALCCLVTDMVTHVCLFGMSTFHIWLTKSHSFPCSWTPSTDIGMRLLTLALSGMTSPSTPS